MIESAPSISIVVPTRNEAQNVRPLVTQIVSCGVPFQEILFVDDNSNDGTRETIRSLAQMHSIRLVDQDSITPGLAGAVISGARAANGEWLLVMDADLSHPADRINDLLEPALSGDADMVIGSRYIAGGSTPGWPVWRRILSRTGAALAYPLTGVHDSMSNFFVISRARLIELEPAAAGSRTAFETILAAGKTLRVKEVPIVFRDRERGRSKMSLQSAAGLLYRWVLAVARGLLKPR
jgi:dolichol-phosphate mannosyltransferase